MGKNLKGKELGKGISQRKDGRYSARFVASTGKRVEKYFTYVGDARQWLADTRLMDLNGSELSTKSKVHSVSCKNNLIPQKLQAVFFVLFEGGIAA